MMTPRGGAPSFPINTHSLLILSILFPTSQVFSLSSCSLLSLGCCCNIDSDMSSGGRLSRKQKGKEVATVSSPSRDVSEAPLEEFDRIHHDAMMDTGNLDLSQRILVSESARSYRQEVRGNPDEPQACERDGSGGAGDRAPPVNYVLTCYYPGGIFEELPAIAPEFMRSPDVSGQAWENITKTQSTPNSVKKLLRERHGRGVTFLIPSASQRPWSPPVGYQCVYESYFRDDMKLWFPIPRLVTSYARRRDAAISQFLNGSWRIAVALMVMAAEIDVSLSVRTFEELTSISSLDDGLLLIKMLPSYNVIGRHPNKTLDWQRSYFFVKCDDSAFEDPPDGICRVLWNTLLGRTSSLTRIISSYTNCFLLLLSFFMQPTIRLLATIRKTFLRTLVPLRDFLKRIGGVFLGRGFTVRSLEFPRVSSFLFSFHFGGDYFFFGKQACSFSCNLCRRLGFESPSFG
ncbi:hypothetical protein YC2023_017215 [Brassica napus]